MAKGVASPWLPGHHNNTNDGSVGLKENAPTQVGGRPPAALPLIGGKLVTSPSKPLVEQFRLGHAPSFPKPAGTMKNCAHRASRCIFSSITSRHRHHRRLQGKPQPSPCHHMPAGSPLHGAGPCRCRNRHTGHCWGLMGVALSFPAEMEIQFLGFAAPF